MLFAPALSVTGIVVVTGVEKLVPVSGTSTAAPPLTLTKNDRLPLSRYVMVRVRLPATLGVTPLTVTKLFAPLPTKPTLVPPEHALQFDSRVEPDTVPDSASTVDPPPLPGTTRISR